jgi:cytochrome bd-type quinol oxidase subunit 2
VTRFSYDPVRARRLADKRRTRGIGGIVVGGLLLALGIGDLALAGLFAGGTAIRYVVTGILVVALSGLTIAVGVINLVAGRQRYRAADALVRSMVAVWVLMLVALLASVVLDRSVDWSSMVPLWTVVVLPALTVQLAAETALAGRYARERSDGPATT